MAQEEPLESITNELVEQNIKLKTEVSELRDKLKKCEVEITELNSSKDIKALLEEQVQWHLEATLSPNELAKVAETFKLICEIESIQIANQMLGPQH